MHSQYTHAGSFLNTNIYANILASDAQHFGSFAYALRLLGHGGRARGGCGGQRLDLQHKMKYTFSVEKEKSTAQCPADRSTSCIQCRHGQLRSV